MPSEKNLRKKLSPELQAFLRSLPLPADDPLSEFCQPWTPTEDPGYSKAFLPLWQTKAGEPSYRSTYVKLGAPPTFHGVANTQSEQAFLGALILRVMAAAGGDRPEALDRGRRAAKAVGFRHFDDATRFLKPPLLKPAREGRSAPVEHAIEALVHFIESSERKMPL
jgi:hypothetical protein